MIIALLAAVLATAFPPPAPNRIDLQIGGVMSGPYRTYVDLDSGIVLWGELPPGSRRGDGAGVATRDLPVARRATLTPARLASLRQLARTILVLGPEEKSRQPCQLTADRMILLNVALDGRAFNGDVYCPSPQVDALFTVFEDANKTAEPVN